MNYPKWLYHKNSGAKIVHSAAQEKALGSGWMESHAAQNMLDVAKAQALFLKNQPKQPKPVAEVLEPKEEPVEKPKRRAKKRSVQE